MKQNLLVTLADKNYILQAKQLFSSVYWNAGWKGDYMLLSHEIPEDELKWFSDKGIMIKKCTPLCHQKTGEFNYPPVIFDKFYLFTSEFKKWNNIVFLDADIIVKGSLERLTKVKYLGAVQDNNINNLNSQLLNPLINKFNDKTYNLDLPAFNSGVIAFNTEIITNELFSELLRLFNNHVTDFKYGDQAILNLCFYKKWEKIPVIYNVFMAYQCFKLPDNLKCILIHFITYSNHFKVWDPKNPYYPEWKKNFEKAEHIDLNKTQKVEKWNILKINYYTFFLKIYLFKYIGKYKLKKIFFYYELKSFFIYKLPHIIYLPGMLIGGIGNFIKKYNPDLYHKLKKLKSGK